MSTAQPIRLVPGQPAYRFVNPDEIVDGLRVERLKINGSQLHTRELIVVTYCDDLQVRFIWMYPRNGRWVSLAEFTGIEVDPRNIYALPVDRLAPR